MSLPSPRQDQVYVQIKALAAGTFTLPEHAFVEPVDRHARRLVPSLCFLIEHQDSRGGRRRLMFDLGLRSEPENYTPAIQKHLQTRQPAQHRPSAPEILALNGIDPGSINAVILSHVHWDHHGDPSEFANATFFVGHGSLDVLQNGLPGRGSHSHFDADLFKHVKLFEFRAPLELEAVAQPQKAAYEHALGCHLQDACWTPVGPFPAAFDLFQDASIFVIPTPGHLPGHVNLLCRTGPLSWMYLAGDSFHDDRLLTGEKRIAAWEQSGTLFCIHFDKHEAEKSIERIRDLGRICEQESLHLEVNAAHDSAWYNANEAECLGSR